MFLIVASSHSRHICDSRQLVHSRHISDSRQPLHGHHVSDGRQLTQSPYL
jgi:hypothetical protein